MEENQATSTIHPIPSVGFPGEQKPKNSGKNLSKWIIAVIGVLIIVVVGGFFVFKVTDTKDSEDTKDEAEGSSLGVFTTPTPIPSPTPAATAEPVAKSELQIEVLNGTGVAGQAGFVKRELEKLDFENIVAGNADEQDADRTVVTFSSNVSKIYIDEITAMLEKHYSDVSTRKGSLTGDIDIKIVTGKTKSSGSSSTSSSATAKSSATPKSTVAASPKASPTPTAGN